MTGLDLQGDKLSVINPAELPQVFSPLTRLEVDTLLPPTLTARSGDDGTFPFLIGLGDVLLTLHTQTGRRFECSLNAETGFWIDFTDNAAIVPLLDTSPRNMNLAVGCDDVPAGFDPGSVAALLRIGLPPLLRNAASDFSYPLPELPLGNFIPLESLKDTTLAFSSMSAQVVGEERRTLLIQAFPTLNFTGSTVPGVGNE